MGSLAMTVRANHVALAHFCLKACKRPTATGPDVERLVAAMVKVHHVEWVSNATVSAWPVFQRLQPIALAGHAGACFVGKVAGLLFLYLPSSVCVAPSAVGPRLSTTEPELDQRLFGLAFQAGLHHRCLASPVFPRNRFSVRFPRTPLPTGRTRLGACCFLDRIA